MDKAEVRETLRRWVDNPDAWDTDTAKAMLECLDADPDSAYGCHNCRHDEDVKAHSAGTCNGCIDPEANDSPWPSRWAPSDGDTSPEADSWRAAQERDAATETETTTKEGTSHDN
jgi:hypothetical protein